jgi:hypothetical protein
MPTYWGDQPLLHRLIWDCSLLLGIIALFIDERKIKYVFLSGAITALVLPWEKFPALTDFFIDYVPMYNKFRAVSSIQVFRVMFSRFSYGITVVLNWIKKCNGKRFGVQER